MRARRRRFPELLLRGAAAFSEERAKSAESEAFDSEGEIIGQWSPSDYCRVVETGPKSFVSDFNKQIIMRYPEASYSWAGLG